MRWSIALVMLVLCASLVLAAPHAYQGFSEPFGASFDGSSLTVADDVIYKTAYYSKDGNPWVSFDLDGSSYRGSETWLSQAGTATIPPLGTEESYIIVYSCSKNNGWQCQDGMWQLLVVGGTGPSDGLILSLDFETSAGGTLQGGASLSQDSVHGGVLSTNGGVFSVPDSNDLDLQNTLSLAAWVKIDSFTPNGKILIKPTNGGQDPWELYSLDVRDGNVRFVLTDALPEAQGGRYETSAAIGTGSWHHVVGTYDGNTMRLYIDATLADPESTSVSIPASNENLLIGGYPLTDCCFFDGEIDDVMIFDYALTGEEIIELYGEEPPTGCIGNPPTRPCNINHGRGEQSMRCIDDEWSGWNTCYVTYCDDGFIPNAANTACVEEVVDCPGDAPTRPCDITNGGGKQSMLCVDGEWSSWGTCYVSYCNNNFIPNAANTACVDAGEQQFLVQNGIAQADIVISPSAPPSVTLAADYLQEYIQEMSGATLPINSNPSSNYNFHVYIGQSSYTDNLGINANGCHDEGFKMVSGSNHLVLLGKDDTQSFPGIGNNPGISSESGWDAHVYDTWGEHYLWRNDILKTHDIFHNSYHDIWESDDMGSLNAVFELLYDQGVRWYYPGDIGTIIPSKSTIGFNPMNKIVNPDYALREFILYGKYFNSLGSSEDFTWVLSLRSNQYNQYTVGSLQGPAHGLHAVTTRQTAAHPEYYAIVDGVRWTPGNVDYSAANLCYPYYTEENTLFEETVKYAKTLFDYYDVHMVNIMPFDGLQAISDECKDKATPERGGGSKYSDYAWEFVNNVAWEIYDDPKYAGKKIINSAYYPYLAPPLYLSKPIAPSLAVSVGRRRNFFGSSEEDIAYSEPNMIAWKDFLATNNHLTGGVETNEIYAVDEYYQRRDTPIILSHYIAQDLKGLKGISRGEYMEVTAGSGEDVFVWNSWNLYVLARYFWDADQDIDIILEEYYTLYYGPARDEMKAFFEYSEEYTPSESASLSTMRNMLSTARSASGGGVYGERIDMLIDAMS